MGHWISTIEGTETGHIVALALALVAAFLHALFGALQKGRHDPWLTRGAVDICYAAIAAPFAFWVVPWPEPHMWPIFAIVMAIHLGYKIAQAQTYSRGAYTVVYPVVRGTGPVITVVGAYLLFGETFQLLQWLGVFVLVAGIFGLSVLNLRTVQVDRATLVPALWLAVLTGVMVAAYTTYDAFGIRATADPFTFLAWFFLLDGLAFPLLINARLRRMAGDPEAGRLFWRGMIGAVVAIFSFGSILMATRLDTVGQAAVLRETSVVFAALIGWLLLKERVSAQHLALMELIAAGAVIVEVGG